MARWASQRSAAACCVAVLLLTACKMRREDESGEGSLDELALLASHAELRLGDSDDPDRAFSSVGSVAVDDEGRVYVVEAMDLQIRVYDVDGRELSRFGRRGEGPGEFVRAPSVGVIGDTVWALQPWPSRISLFTREGRHLATRRVTDVRAPLAGGGAAIVTPQFMGEGGLFVGFSTITGGSGSSEPSGIRSEDIVRVPRVRFALSGSAVDTIGWDHRDPPVPFPRDYLMIGGNRYFRPQPLRDDPIRILVADGFIVVHRDVADGDREAEVRIMRVRFPADTVYIRTFGYRPVPCNEVVLDEITSATARRRVVILSDGMHGWSAVEPGPDSMQVLAALRSAIDLPPFQPPIRGHRMGNDGTLWLRREDAGDAVLRWVVLDEDGKPLGQLELPRRMRVVWSRGDRFWAVLPDAQDVPWLLRYRIPDWPDSPAPS